MDIFRHRPLFFACSVFLLASAVGFFLPADGKWMLACLVWGAVAVFSAIAVVKRHRQKRTRAGMAIAMGIAVSLALLLSHLTFHGSDDAYLQAREQTVVYAEGVVTDRRGSGGYLTAYTLELTSVNGRPLREKAVLTCHYVSDLQPGYTVALEATVVPLSEAAGDGYDATALLGDGYSVGLLSESETTVTVTSEESDRLLVRAGELRRALAARLTLLTDEGGEGLPSAMLLGDRSALSDSVRRDFARAGVSHLLAISGLHITLLFGMLAAFLKALRLSRLSRTGVLMGSMTVYLLLLGFPPSATRAVIMLGMVYGSALYSSHADPLTSLGLAGAVILTVSPHTVADAGFWMSYLATLGLIALMPVLSADTFRCRPWRMLRRLVTALLVGVVAMSFTLFIVAVVIGELGILSPLTTVLLSPLCAALLILSLLTLALGWTPLGVPLGMLSGKVCGWMMGIAAGLGSPSWAVISLRHPAVPVVAAVMTAGVLILLAVRLPRYSRTAVLLPLLVGWITLGGILGGHHLLTRNEVDFTYLQTSSPSEALVLVSGNQGFVCDLSNGSLTALTASAGEVEARGGTEIAALMLTHYHSRTAGALTTLLARETVRALWLPRPKDTEDYYLLLACLDSAERAGVPTYLYDDGEALTVCGGGTVTSETVGLKRSTQPVHLVSLSFQAQTGEESILYCGSAVFESDLADRAAELTAAADTVIFGSHGPLLKAPYGEGLDFSHADAIVFSAYGDTAAWFDPSGMPEELSAWVGSRRSTLTLP